MEREWTFEHVVEFCNMVLSVDTAAMEYLGEDLPPDAARWFDVAQHHLAEARRLLVLGDFPGFLTEHTSFAHAMGRVEQITDIEEGIVSEDLHGTW